MNRKKLRAREHKSPPESVRPVHRRIQTIRAAQILEAKQTRGLRRRTLKRQIAEILIRAFIFRRARLHAILLARGQHRRLIVVGARARQVRQRVFAKQRLRLRTHRNHAARIRHAGRRIVNLHRRAGRVQRLRKISTTLQHRGHAAGQHTRIVIRHVLIRDEKIRAGNQVMPKSDRSAYRARDLEVVVGRLRRKHAAQRKRGRIPARRVERHQHAAVVKRARAAPIVSKRRHLRERRRRAIVHAAVDQEAGRSALIDAARSFT